MSNIRKDIMKHLELNNRVREAVREFVEKDKQKDAIIQKHFSSAEDFQILCKFFNAKINIIEEKNKYLKIKNKFKRAVRISSSKTKISEIARKYNISYRKLLQECRKFMSTERRSYEYDDIISYEDVFTFEEELSLLECLNTWKTNSTSCSCRYCALEHLLSLAYITAFTKNKTYPSTWNVHKKADKQWLYKFEMRYSDEISEYLLSCTKYLTSVSSASQSPSFNVTILEPSTLSKHQICEKIKLENDMQKIVKIYKRFDIRQRITNFLNLSEQLMSAAEGYLQKNLENVVQRYESQSEEERRILISIIFILEEDNKYLEEKNDCEKAVPYLLNFNGSMENAAKNYNINLELLENEIENYKLLNNIFNHRYEYDKIICTLECLNITYIEESLLLEKLYTWVEESQSLCSCQICVLEHLYNLITDTITNYKDQKSHMSTDKIKKLNEEWFCEFVIRYKRKISEFSSNCKKDETTQKFLLLLDKEEVPKTSISSADLQRNFDSLHIPNANMMSIRQKILDYLNLNNRLEKAAEEVINKKSNKETVTQKYGFNSEDRRTLDKKIEIEKKKHQYFTSKNALDKTLNLIIETNKKSNLIAIAEYSQDIFYKTVHDEYTKYNESKVTYKYDDYVSNHKVLTYNDEFSLLDKLDIWKTKSQSCTCQVCALENVYYLVYIFTNINKLEEIWENEMIHGNWICEFVMRHSAKISEFSNYSACKRKDKFLTAMSAPQFSPSKLAKGKSLESNTPNIIPLQCADPEIYFARTQEKERFTKRAEIVDHLSESKWFQSAAEEVINNKKEVVNVAPKYGFHSRKDREALNKRIDILKKKRKYFELKHKIEEAVKTILSDNITEVAEKYNIDKSILNEEFKKYSASENKDNYIYNQFTSDNEMLTYSQESMLLTLLQKWKDNPKGSCHCWFCALEYLCKQAYIMIETKNPIEWNKHAQADVNWLYEFEMRYSKEIVEILPSCMKCSLEWRSASHSEEETSKSLQKRLRMH